MPPPNILHMNEQIKEQEFKEPPFYYRWLALVVISIAMAGNYYIYDSINPVVDILVKQLNFTYQQIGWLNSSYSLAALLTLIIGGLIIDRFGTRKSILIFSLICLLGAGITAFHGSFLSMAIGRTILGLGAESLIVAVTTALAKWFKGKELSFAFGLNLTIARLASVSADNSPTWAKSVFYPSGLESDPSWQGPMMIAVAAGLLTVIAAGVYWLLEEKTVKHYKLGQAGEVDKLNIKETFRFNRSYWLVVGLCFTFYSAIFPFRTFAIKFFQDFHFANLAEDIARSQAGFFNSLLPLTAMIATPIFGIIADKFGKRATLMMIGSILLMPVYLLMIVPGITLWIPITMMGISFSLIPAVMWPSVAYIIDEKRLGTAYALMTLIQQIGFFSFNLIIGQANDLAQASSSNPYGYSFGMWIFSTLGFLGFFFALWLRKRETGENNFGLEIIKK